VLTRDVDLNELASDRVRLEIDQAAAASVGPVLGPRDSGGISGGRGGGTGFGSPATSREIDIAAGLRWYARGSYAARSLTPFTPDCLAQWAQQ
jgi:hypothetical protein